MLDNPTSLDQVAEVNEIALEPKKEPLPRPKSQSLDSLLEEKDEERLKNPTPAPRTKVKNLELRTEDEDEVSGSLTKTKSCGAGLDDNNQDKKERGSLLSLPTGVEPKRKKNFMDKCVNKVRLFIKK